MRDSDVRSAVKDWLGSRYGTETRIVEEMGIWSGSVRIDVAVINGELQGFELKSERDTLARLESQAELYNQVFDRMTLVTAKRHLDKAVSKVPNWWGITCATMTQSDGAKLCQVRQARRNPNIDPIQLARLLWRPEALAILERRGLSRGFKSRPAEVICARLVDVLSLKELASEVRETLKCRVDWLGKPVSNQREMAVGNETSPHRSAATSGRVTGDLLDSVVSPTTDF
jgi:hypothetical protein